LASYFRKVKEKFKAYDSNRDHVLDFQEFQNFLQDAEKSARAYPATAQVAAQQGEYIGKRLNAIARHAARLAATQRAAGVNPNAIERDVMSISTGVDPHLLLPPSDDRPFRYRHFGNLAYIGKEHAAFDFGEGRYISGVGAFWLWKSVYLSKQVSNRTRVALAFDWFKSSLFGMQHIPRLALFHSLSVLYSTVHTVQSGKTY
jgi:NADH dehydrogenase FAD-containing subunit